MGFFKKIGSVLAKANPITAPAVFAKDLLGNKAPGASALGYTNSLTAPFTLGRDLLYKNPAAPQDQYDSRDTYVPIRGSSKAQELANTLFGNNDPQGYKNVVNRAFQSLSQPLNDNQPGRQNIAVEAARGLASSFADRVLQRTGTLPSEDAMRQFVSQNLTEGFAAKFIQGMPPDQISNLADQYLQGNPDALNTPGAKSAEEQRLSGLTDQLNKIYDTGRANYVSAYDTDVFNPAKTRAVEERAALGNLNQGTTNYVLGQLEGNRSRDVSSGINQLEGQRAAGSIDLAKNIEDLLQRNRDRSQSAYQFNQGFNADREDTFFNRALQQKQFDLTGQLGKLQANANKKGPLDYLNTATNLAGTAGSLYTGIGGLNQNNKYLDILGQYYGKK